MKTIACGVAAVLVAGASAAVAAETLVRYETPGSTFDPTFVAAGMIATPLNNTGSGTGTLSPGNALPNSVYHGYGGIYPTPQDAIAAGQWFAFTLDTQGQTVSLAEFSFDAARGGDTGLPRGYAVLSSVDNYTSILGTAELTTRQPTMLQYTVNLSTAAFQGLSGEITFRIYSYAGTGTGGGNFYRNITVTGSLGSPCYADCDGSELLNIDDFLCFINEFAVAQMLPVSQQIEHYANCDGSTTEPVLTIDDFLCFINEFALGCP